MLRDSKFSYNAISTYKDNRLILQEVKYLVNTLSDFGNRIRYAYIAASITDIIIIKQVTIFLKRTI